MHASVLGFFVSVLGSSEVRGKSVLEVGSGDVNGSVRPIVEARNPAFYLGVDMTEGPGVDKVLDATKLTEELEPGSFDVVISTEMMEHVEDWQTTFINLFEMVKPGGVIVVTTRSVPFGYHPHPIDTWRYTPDAMVQILDAVRFDKLLVCPDPDPVSPGVFFKARKPLDWHAPAVNPAILFGHVVGVTATVKPYNYLALPFAPDGSGYYRMYLPFKHLSTSSGHNIYIPPPGRNAALPTVEDVEPLDLLSMQRAYGEGGVAAFRAWKGNVKIVYECDDDMLRVDTSGLPHLFNEAGRETTRECIRLADLVTVSTEPLAELYRQYNDNVVVLPNYINGELLDLERPHRDDVVVGWAGGNSHLIDWVSVQDAVKATLADHPDVDLHFIGHDWSPLLGKAARFDPWEPSVWNYYKHIDFDIGLAPMGDTPFNSCKSHIRVLEYAALGIPVIASDCAAYRDFVVDGVTGYLVHNEKQWQGRLTELINESDARAELGAKAKLLATGYTIQEHWRDWNDAYERIAQS
jgi:glycosyltransferase involved in cell wall biosynthesis